jgi:hypothetical protein
MPTITYKNTEIADEYNVAKATVTRWIDNALTKKNNLQLYKVGNKFRILKSQHNRAEMLRLSEQGVVYRNKASFSTIEPDPKIYEIFSVDQIIDLITNLEQKHQIPHKYLYAGPGANKWNDFYNHSLKRGIYQTPRSVVSLYQEILTHLLNIIDKDRLINVVEFGPSNGQSIQDFLKDLISHRQVLSYTAVSLSDELNKIATNNVAHWFKELDVYAHQWDIFTRSAERVIFENQLRVPGSINLIICSGETVGLTYHMEEVLRNLSKAMSQDDILILSNDIDNEQNRTTFTYLGDLENDHSRLTWLVSMLGIDIEKSELKVKYNSHYQTRNLNIVLDKNYAVNFRLFNHHRKVNLFRQNELNIWSQTMFNLIDLPYLLINVDLDITALNLVKDRSHAMLVAKHRKSYNS